MKVRLVTIATAGVQLAVAYVVAVPVFFGVKLARMGRRAMPTRSAR
jgi:hypothetical protein